MYFAIRLLPWLQLNASSLYLSNENCIQVYNNTRGHKRLAKPIASVACGEHDVTRFVVKDDLLVSGSKNHVLAWTVKDRSYGKKKTFVGHTKTVYCVEALGHILLSGSRDRSIKVQNFSKEKQGSFSFRDGFWSEEGTYLCTYFFKVKIFL